jgi:hypothetical protein
MAAPIRAAVVTSFIVISFCLAVECRTNPSDAEKFPNAHKISQRGSMHLKELHEIAFAQ